MKNKGIKWEIKNYKLWLIGNKEEVGSRRDRWWWSSKHYGMEGRGSFNRWDLGRFNLDIWEEMRWKASNRSGIYWITVWMNSIHCSFLQNPTWKNLSTSTTTSYPNCIKLKCNDSTPRLVTKKIYIFFKPMFSFVELYLENLLVSIISFWIY